MERVSWFRPIHYEILEFFEQHDIYISPRDLSKNIDYNRKYTGDACRYLEKAGLLENKDGIYYLSSQGKSYLKGLTDPTDLTEPDLD